MPIFLWRGKTCCSIILRICWMGARTLLIDLAEERQLKQAIQAMFAGEIINKTEQRPAHHVALRLPEEQQTNGEIGNTPEMSALVEKIHTGDWTGHTGRSIETVINIGIGGSDLGPAMVVEALRSECLPADCTVRFQRRSHHMQQMLGKQSKQLIYRRVQIMLPLKLLPTQITPAGGC